MRNPEQYFGNDITADTDFDALAIAFIDANLFLDESKLYKTKWWDYRFMHPSKATLIFAQNYKDAIKRALRIRSDVYRAANFKGLKDANLFMNAKATYTGMWKARQAADKHGVPYDFWCWKAMEYAEERNWQYLPKPQQLYSTTPHKAAKAGDPSIVEYILNEWAKRVLSGMETAVEEAYCLDNYIKHPYQRAYQSWLIGRINVRSLRAETVGYLVYEIKQLAAELIMKIRDDGEYLLRKGKSFVELN